MRVFSFLDTKYFLLTLSIAFLFNSSDQFGHSFIDQLNKKFQLAQRSLFTLGFGHIFLLFSMVFACLKFMVLKIVIQ